MADSYIQLPPDSTGKRLDAEELTVNSVTVQRQRVISLQGRATQQPGRIWANRRNSTAKSADSTLQAGSVTSGYHYYVTNIMINGYNTDTLNPGQLDILDGTSGSGTHRMSFRWPPAVTGAPAPQISMSMSYPIEPMLFQNGIYLDFISGTLSVVMTCTGYEEPIP